MQFYVNVRQISSAPTFINNVIKDINISIDRSLDDIGEFVRKEARANAPHEDGELARSISYNKSIGKVEIGVPQNTKAHSYAAIMEYGTYDRGEGTVAKGYRAGKMFLNRAVRDNIYKIKQMIYKNIRDQF